MVHAALTTLGGALCRTEDGWRWSDGQPAPVRDMHLRDLAPNWRCRTYGRRCYVEIPHDWRDPRHWPHRHVDEDAAREIAAMIRDEGRLAAIYAEGLAELADDHRLRKHGHLVPIEVWDAALGHVCGCWWDREHETAILDRARRLGA